MATVWYTEPRRPERAFCSTKPRWISLGIAYRTCRAVNWVLSTMSATVAGPRVKAAYTWDSVGDKFSGISAC